MKNSIKTSAILIGAAALVLSSASFAVGDLWANGDRPRLGVPKTISNNKMAPTNGASHKQIYDHNLGGFVLVKDKAGH